MKVCDTKDCVMPAVWKARMVARTQPHWGDGTKLVDTGCCFCKMHRAEAALDKLFTPRARRALDVTFIKAGLQPPDWALSTLEWVGVDPRSGAELAPPPPNDPPYPPAPEVGT